MLSDLYGSVSGPSAGAAMNAEAEERTLAMRKARAAELESMREGRTSTSGFKSLLSDQRLAGNPSEDAIRELARDFRVDGDTLVRTLRFVRVPKVRKSHDGYLVADRE